MSALYTNQPTWPVNPRVARQSTFFNNEGWQLRSGTELSGLDDSNSFSTLVAAPGHLTDFITAPDGIRPTGSGDDEAAAIITFQRLITWVGFVDDNGKEVGPGYTKSVAAGGNINVDVVFSTDIDFAVGDLGVDMSIHFVQNTDTAIHFEGSVSNVTVTSPTPNILRHSIALATPVSGFFQNGIDEGTYALSPGTLAADDARIFFGGTFHITTVAETGHTAVDLFPLAVPAAGANIPFTSDMYDGSTTITIIA